MTVSTYHCICTELLLATTAPLHSLPTRQSDKSHICKIASGEDIKPDTAILTKSAVLESKPLVLKLEDGFEKRYLVKCTRCGVAFGYRLGKEEENGAVEEDVVFLLPNGLIGTADVESGMRIGEEQVELKAGVAV